MKLRSKLRKVALYATIGLGMPIAFLACNEDVLNTLASTTDTVAALKEALTIGSKTAATNLGQEGGYLNDLAVKIGMPEEVATVVELANTSAGKTFLTAIGASVFNEEELVTLMNRAAEEAAPEAAGIFSNAITSMTISDGETILFGAENAATEYLRDKTYDGLTVTFGKVVRGTFDQVSVSGHTLNDAWSGFSTYYNRLADLKSSAKGQIAMATLKVGLAAAGKDEIYNKVNSIQTVNTDLGEYVTGKALDGLFVKVADKEKGIRTNVAERTSELLQRVFGRLDE